jgi:hypothetical protein
MTAFGQFYDRRKKCGKAERRKRFFIVLKQVWIALFADFILSFEEVLKKSIWYD